MMKRVLSMVMALCLLSACAVGALAGSDVPHVVVYGNLESVPASGDIWNRIVEQYKGTYDIELISVDTENIDKIIQTGIASGEPADIYFKQAQYMKAYVDAGMAYDLTPALTANDNEWLNTFNRGAIDVGNYGGKYYNIPMAGVYGVYFYNADLMASLGIEVPVDWTWAQFLDVCAQIKEKSDVYPYAICGLCNDFMARNALLSLGYDQGTVEAWGAGEIPCSDPLLAQSLAYTKDLYDKGYWWPKDGAMITTRDEVVAAFQQGLVAFIGDVNVVSGIVEDGATFEIGVAAWPKVGAVNYSLGGADGFFIPANAKNAEIAVQLLKDFTSDAMQQVFVDAGNASPNMNVQSDNALINKFNTITTMIYPTELMYITNEMQSFWQDELIEDYCLGNRTLDELLARMEALRLEAVGG